MLLQLPCDLGKVISSFWVLVFLFVSCGPDELGGNSGSSILLFPDEQDSLPQLWPCLSKGRDQTICCCNTQVAKTFDSPEGLSIRPLERSSKALGQGENWGVSLTTGLEEGARC